ncbi:hypothetical protein CBS101457_005550 [Exobasidium rhododendri]|nr:hypothetical protein CBS101457_005550 [Exobasidium rhododendri]
MSRTQSDAASKCKVKGCTRLATTAASAEPEDVGRDAVDDDDDDEEDDEVGEASGDDSEEEEEEVSVEEGMALCTVLEEEEVRSAEPVVEVDEKMAEVGVAVLVLSDAAEVKMVLSGMDEPEKRVKDGSSGLLGTARQVSSFDGC